MTMLTDSLPPAALLPFHEAATAPLEINSNFRIGLFNKLNDIVTYNKHSGKKESAFTMACDIYRSIQAAVLQQQRSTTDSGSFAALLDQELETLYRTKLVAPGDALTHQQLTSFLIKVAESVEYYLTRCSTLQHTSACQHTCTRCAP